MYYALIVTGFIAAVAVHFLNSSRYTHFKKSSVILAVSAAVSLAAVSIFLHFHSKGINYRNGIEGYRIIFSFLFTSALLLAVAGTALTARGMDAAKNLNAFLPSLLIFLAFGKLGCAYAGCCASVETAIGIIPFHIIESLFGFGFFAVSFFYPKFNLMDTAVPVYCLYRFVSDFYRPTFEFEQLPLGLSAVQLVSAAVIVYFAFKFAIYILTLQKSVKGAENE